MRNTSWAVVRCTYTRRLSSSGAPVLKMPRTWTSTAFSAPWVVLASSVSELPSLAPMLCARSLPSITSASDLRSGVSLNERPSTILKNGPRMANSCGSTAAPMKIEVLSPLLTRPENWIRGNNARTRASACSSRRRRSWSAKPNCIGFSSSRA